MGKVLATLARTKVPKQAVFGERFVVECCETFHLHYRNVRFDLDAKNFRRVRTAMEEVSANHRSAGEPDQHPHLELGRAMLDMDDGPDELSIELCENLYKQWPTGWDSRFHSDDSFIHMHWRDLRLEMSNSEFQCLAETMGEAHRTLRSWKLKSLAEVFELLDQERIVYAVIRNWEALPDRIEVGAHSDLDLLVHPHHVVAFDELLDARPTTDLAYRVQRRLDVMGPEGPTFINTDVRSPGDGYFPDDLANRMLARRVRARNFWVLHPEDHLLGLAYHMVHHKGIISGDYIHKMTKLAERIGLSGPPEGVEWAYALGLLRRAGIEVVIPEDETVRPFLPFVVPPERVVTSRFLAVHEGVPVVSRVYATGTGNKRQIIKHTTGSFLRHEYDVLKSLDTPYFPSVSDYQEKGGHSTFVESFIDGTSLEKAESVIRRWGFDTARDFVCSCTRLMGCLADSGIAHRDIRANNILISNDQPVLLDFGWATSRSHPFSLPDAEDFGGEERVPEGPPCDAYSMGFVLQKHIGPHFPEVRSIADALLRCRADDEPNWAQIEQQVCALTESLPSDPFECFARLCERGRYAEARSMLPAQPGDEQVSNDVRFWQFHLARCGEGSDGWMSNVSASMEAAIPTYPEAAFSNPTLAARLIQEAFAADVSEPRRGLLSLAAHHLGGSTGQKGSPWRKPFPVLDAIATHYTAFAPVLDHTMLREAFTRAERGDEWLSRHAGWLCGTASDASRTAFVQFIETSGARLTPETAESLTEIYAELGLTPQAVNLSRSVLHDNPYSTVCARTLADHHDRQREAEEGLDMWRRIATISDSNRHARARIREIHHQLRSKTHAPSLDPATLPDDPQQLFSQIREWVRSGDYEVALVGARKLVTLAPEFGQAAGELLDQLQSLARSGSASSRSLRIVVEPLSDETYRESSKEKLEQLSQLAQTPLGRHQIVREELVKLLKETGVGHDHRDRIEDELKAS